MHYKLDGKKIFLIFLIALVFRVWKLGEFPYGFHADEARVGWNALSILKTGKDDRGNKFALYYNTFGDYRPTGIFYLTVPSIAIFGRNEFAVRFPSAILGALTVFPLYFFVLKVTNKKNLGLISALLLAISPWHVEVSRATSEVAISTFFALFALYFFVLLIKTQKWKFAFLSIIFVAISYLLYHAIRFLAPPFYLIIALYYLRDFKKTKIKWIVIGSLVAVFLLSLYFSVTPQAKKRFSQVSIFSDIDMGYEISRIRSENKTRNLLTTIFDNKEVIYTRRFLNEYAIYFGGGFLLSDLARPYRYITPGVGLLTYVEFIFFALGIIEIAKGKRSFLPLALLLIAPIPAAITAEDAPNLHRAFFMVPFLMTIEAYGLTQLLSFSKKHSSKIMVSIFALLILNFAFFLHMYFNHSQIHKPFIENLVLDGSSYRNVGAKELVFELEKLKGRYDKIIVTNFPDDPYPWYAFFTDKDPKDFNSYAIKRVSGSWTYGNLVFSNLRCPSDDSFVEPNPEKLLVIDSWPCAYESKIRDGLPVKVIDKIKRPDGSEVYIFLARK
ncbi:glycosyltransferase family 39 protein [Candidatus Woesebacteria bacterium]|nr:glycosyltransferase family 39 protein [Candidatus Woesebacteria bacterium]